MKALDREHDRITPWVFPHLDGPHQGERRQSCIKRWRAACTATGLPGRIVHDLRRSAVRNMERDGVPRSVATRITGHRTESIDRRYGVGFPTINERCQTSYILLPTYRVGLRELFEDNRAQIGPLMNLVRRID